MNINQCVIHCSSNFLTKCFPETWAGWNQDEARKFIEEHITEAYQDMDSLWMYEEIVIQGDNLNRTLEAIKNGNIN